MSTGDTLASVQRYYGEVLASSQDLKTSACCSAEALPSHVWPLLERVHPEVRERFYGCGSPIPAALEGATVLDLGCGAGRDVYLLAQLVGPSGTVIGVDMTVEQLSVARRHQTWHAERFGHVGSNVRFVDGYIEDLASAGIADASVDVVVSNCVLNLSPDKPRVFREIFRVLKPGGELFFSDIVADRRLPAAWAQDPVLLGECLGGALYREDLRRLLAEVGCADARTVSATPLTIGEVAIADQMGNTRFSSVTMRAFRLPLEDRCEDFGQVATYLGTLPGLPHAFVLDDHHRLETGRPMLVCGNTADMLSATRYAPYMRLQGEKRTHFGIFDCAGAPAPSAPSAGPPASGAGCC